MLDILIPVHLPNLSLVRTCVEAIDKRTPGVPYKLWIATDGVTKADFSEIDVFLNSRKVKLEPTHIGRLGAHQISHDPQPKRRDWEVVDWPSIYFQSIVVNMASRFRGDLLLILPPWIVMEDDRWFGKVQQPCIYDPHTMLVAIPRADAPRGTMAPGKFLRRQHPTTESILTRRIVVGDVIPRMKEVRTIREWVVEFSRVAESLGGSRWLASSVRYHEIEHKEWQQPERSETETERSESPSPTIPSSSSQTITDQDGSGVSVPF